MTSVDNCTSIITFNVAYVKQITISDLLVYRFYMHKFFF